MLAFIAEPATFINGSLAYIFPVPPRNGQLVFRLLDRKFSI